MVGSEHIKNILAESIVEDSLSLSGYSIFVSFFMSLFAAAAAIEGNSYASSTWSSSHIIRRQKGLGTKNLERERDGNRFGQAAAAN
jgi:hypothetical protein